MKFNDEKPGKTCCKNANPKEEKQNTSVELPDDTLKKVSGGGLVLDPSKGDSGNNDNDNGSSSGRKGIIEK